MKLNKIYIAILFILTTFSYSCAQDSRLFISKGWIRWDDDSATFRFSSKIAPENNFRLFNFNPDQFAWSPSSGLNLKNQPNDTNISLKRLTIYRDSIVNEYIKSRSYTFLKPFYAHQYDLYDLVVNYQSNENGTIVENKNINLFNNCYTIYDNQDLNQVLTEGAFSFGWSFANMKKGQYYVVVNYEYEFADANARSLDKIEAVIQNLDNANIYCHNTHSFTHTDAFSSSQINTASMSCIISPTNSENKNINVSFQATSDASLKIKLTKLRIIAILIN